jgi:hypothetical protein
MKRKPIVVPALVAAVIALLVGGRAMRRRRAKPAPAVA